MIPESPTGRFGGWPRDRRSFAEETPDLAARELAFIEQAGLTEEVELEVRGNTVVIAATRRARAGWADAARALAAAGDGRLMDPETRTQFDEDEWRW